MKITISTQQNIRTHTCVCVCVCTRTPNNKCKRKHVHKQVNTCTGQHEKGSYWGKKQQQQQFFSSFQSKVRVKYREKDRKFKVKSKEYGKKSAVKSVARAKPPVRFKTYRNRGKRERGQKQATLYAGENSLSFCLYVLFLYTYIQLYTLFGLNKYYCNKYWQKALLFISLSFAVCESIYIWNGRIMFGVCKSMTMPTREMWWQWRWWRRTTTTTAMSTNQQCRVSLSTTTTMWQ